MRAIQQPGAATTRDLSEADNARELDALRVTCWRQAQEIRSLLDTVAILRAGANRLAIMNAEIADSSARERQSSRRLRADSWKCG
jgi:hypothetical protein